MAKGMCQNCGKGAMHGSYKQHRRGVAGKRWSKRAQKVARLFRPNLQTVSIVADGEKKRLILCAKCIKRFKSQKKLFSQKISLGGSL